MNYNQLFYLLRPSINSHKYLSWHPTSQWFSIFNLSSQCLILTESVNLLQHDTYTIHIQQAYRFNWKVFISLITYFFTLPGCLYVFYPLCYFLTFCTNCGFTVISWSIDFSFSSSSIHFNICKQYRQGRKYETDLELSNSLWVSYPHLLIDFVKHCWVVVFLRVVMEADHAILLVNASIDLAIFNLSKNKRMGLTEVDETIINKMLCLLWLGLTMCNTYFSASWGPDSCTRLAMSCKESVRKVCRKQKTCSHEIKHTLVCFKTN